MHSCHVGVMGLHGSLNNCQHIPQRFPEYYHHTTPLHIRSALVTFHTHSPASLRNCQAICWASSGLFQRTRTPASSRAQTAASDGRALRPVALRSARPELLLLRASAVDDGGGANKTQTQWVRL